jgi:hypothetical protein
MKKILSIVLFTIISFTVAFGQAAVSFPVLVEDNAGFSQVIDFGLDLTATDGIDVALGEGDLPPPPPGNAFDARWWIPPFAGALSSWKDYRAPGTPPAFPFTGQIQHNIKFQTTDYPVTISWNLPPEIASTSVIRDLFGGVLINASFSGNNSLVITNAAIGQLQVLVDYVNIAPSGPAPEFTIAPPSLNFGTVAVGSSAVLQATVTNTGDANLEITNITSSNGQFTFTPNGPYPLVILPAGNLVFDITFTPTAAGPQAATITFTHNAGSPTAYSVQGTGTEPGPTFRVEPGSLNFGNVGVGSSANLNVTVYNDGSVNPLNITAASATPGVYTVSPSNAVVPPLGNQVFTVTFTPTAPGVVAGTLTFTHNAPGSPSNVSLSGNGVATFGLIFEKDTVVRLEDDSYTDIIQLMAIDPPGGAKVQALQFRLLVNKRAGDNTILTFQNIQKGLDVADPSWVLNYNIFRGPIQANGASQDEIYVLLYNLNQNGGLPPGNYTELLKVKYRVADLPALQDLVPSSFLITNAEASTNEGFAIDITPSRDYMMVLAQNRVSGLGDVNGDGCLDILDLIMVVDHIIGVDSLETDEFARADIAPWSPGATEPNPDGFVNVQDLSLIQNIILTGFFPNGIPVGPCTYAILPKIGGEAEAKVTIYINSEGITTYLESTVAIRGAQIEFANVNGDPTGMVINTELGQGYYLQVGDLLRTLQYDRLAQKYIEAGEHFMADMPFRISNPEEVTLDKIILVNMDRQILTKIQVEMIYGNPPALPLDYILWQNFPNPFNPSTTVKFQIPQTSDVTIKIYDMLGQEVRTLFAGEVLRGTYSVDWDGKNDAGQQMSSGSYIYRMVAGEFMQAKKMILIK